MTADRDESLMDMFVFETTQNIEQLEQLMIENESAGSFSERSIDEIFRIMHTIKGSAAMMDITHISRLAHCMEDLFSYFREQEGSGASEADESVVDIVLESMDFIKTELAKIQNGEEDEEGEAEEAPLCGRIEELFQGLKNGEKADSSAPGFSGALPETAAEDEGEERDYKYSYRAEFRFEDGCQMESIRACNVILRLQSFAGNLHYYPEDVMESDESVLTIREKGVQIFFDSDREYRDLYDFFIETPFVTNLSLETLGQVHAENAQKTFEESKEEEKESKTASRAQGARQPEGAANHPSAMGTSSIISVNVGKLDRLMDLLGELVISEAMVIHNPELSGLTLDGFQKAATQLRKITGEMQDMVMSIRMVELTATFQRMKRIVRDMSKKLNKQVDLVIIGEDTQVDKNIIEHISDPLMHLVRNALDHGIESAEERIAAGKPEIGTITLEARNEGSEVLICVRDDGRGLNKEKILSHAREAGLIDRPESEFTEKEIYSMIFLPGFSTKDEITEFSGRGVGMDVVVKNIETVGGKISVESVPGKGCANIMRFPITLAIIEGMNIRVGDALYTIPITEIRQSFRPKTSEIIRDPDMNEMLMVRGNAYPVLRLYELFGVEPDIRELEQGIIIMLDAGERAFCVFADELLGQQEVVVKALPGYIKKCKGLAGCTLLGDGSISLILDTGNLVNTRHI